MKWITKDFLIMLISIVLATMSACGGIALYDFILPGESLKNFGGCLCSFWRNAAHLVFLLGQTILPLFIFVRRSCCWLAGGQRSLLCKIGIGHRSMPS